MEPPMAGAVIPHAGRIKPPGGAQVEQIHSGRVHPYRPRVSSTKSAALGQIAMWMVQKSDCAQ
jgi:hypothetical protein